MADIRIPKSGHIAFRKLVDLPASDFEAMLEAVSQTAPAATPDLFWKHVAKGVPNIPETTIENIIDELFSLNYTRESLSASAEEFAKMVTEAVVAQSPKKSPIGPEEKDVLLLRLTQLLEWKASLSVTSKALEILTDAERVFYSAKVLTDVRPIFDDEGRNVQAAVIIHNLRIHYGKDSEHHDFFVALDTNDIKELQSVLERADKKAESLEALLGRAKVSYLKVED
jgi:hypothetical protein